MPMTLLPPPPPRSLPTKTMQSSSLMSIHQHRILIYTTCYNVLDGVTLTIRKIEQEILAQGHHVCILTTKSGNMNNTHMDGEHPHRTVLFLDNSIPIPFVHDPNHPDESYHLGFSLSGPIKQKIEAFEPTLIHITVPDNTCLHLIQYARTKELPLMGTYHSNIPDYMDHYPRIGWLKHVLNAFFRHSYNFLQALYVPTPFIRQRLTDTLQMDKVTNLGVWGRGIDLERFSPKHRSTNFRAQYGFDDRDVVLLWCGRLVPEKRPDIFASVVRRLSAEGVPFKSLVVGAGPCEDEIKALPNTTFAGWMSGDELAVAYASSDIFLFPSAVETFGNVTLEAAASGLPLVVEEGCSGHLVNHGVNGFACQDGDLEGYVNSTLCLVLDDMRRKSMSKEGRLFSQQFEKRAVCRKMIDNYATVTDEFYSGYGGHHANRDVAYTKHNSFLGGNYPRPIVLVLVEYIFIMIFRVMYQMAIMFFHVQGGLLPPPIPSRKGAKQQPNSSRKVSPPAALPLIPPPPSQLLTLDSIVEVEEGSDCDADSHQKRHKQQQHHQSSSTTSSSLMKAFDDETDDADTDSTASARSDESIPVFSCRRKSSIESLPLSHVLTIGFVQCLMFQTRMENRIRKGVGYMMSPSNWNLKRKRKHSALTVDDLSMLDLQRKESRERSSGSDLSVEEIEVMMTHSSRDDRLNLRRANVAV